MSEIYNETYAERYEGTIMHPYTQYKLDLLTSRITDTYDGPVVLDVGCNINPFHPQGLRRKLGELVTYTGVDVAPAYFAASDGSARVVAGSGDNLPFKDESFDAVVAADVLEHIPSLGATASEISRVLKPAGRAFIVIPQLYKLDALQLPEMRAWRQTSHVHFLTADQWKNAIEVSSELELNEAESTSLGVLSGLLYVAWLSPDFITHQDKSPRHAELFARAKREASLLDPLMDNVYRRDIAADGRLKASLCKQDLLGSLITALDIAEEHGGPENTQTLRELAKMFAEVSDHESDVRNLLAQVAMSKELSAITSKPYSTANSALLVFEKRQETGQPLLSGVLAADM